ncbi:unnamed protein product [Allacma fusca]|uniref:K Homology domain-containing protein n=1 Tax=Allacma fusca TaxID=39272 RepID=A0A8J2LY04_9HEXA|nr:unnamed protein product [Allacma fusca]
MSGDENNRSRSRSRGRSNPNASATGGAIQQSNELPLRILVSSEMVGAIIGRGGATIRNITQGSRARVDVHRKENVGSVEKAITIYGSPENSSAACKKILEVMSQEASNTNKGDITLKILAHNSLIGRIIGKGGATIKKIMQETDTKINVSSVTEIPSPTSLNIERVISIRGSVDGMSAAENLISTKLRNSYQNDLQALTPNNPVSMFPGLHPMAMMSTLGGSPLSNPHLQQRSNIAAALQAHHHQAVIQPSIPPPTSTPGVTSTLPYPLFPTNQVQETVHMYIPNSAVGAVIGTKGTHIRNIIRFSGASVKIATTSPAETNATTATTPTTTSAGSGSNATPTPATKDASKAEERQVTIVGTPEAQWKAQCMIFEKMREEGYVPPNEEPRLTVEISVPSSQVGRIIGKGGANVRELQRLTGAIIKFPTTESSTTTGSTTANSTTNAASADPNSQTNVHILGTFYSVQSAQRRIRAMLLTGRN